jgi:hypothetical protein
MYFILSHIYFFKNPDACNNLKKHNFSSAQENRLAPLATTKQRGKNSDTQENKTSPAG